MIYGIISSIHQLGGRRFKGWNNNINWSTGFMPRIVINFLMLCQNRASNEEELKELLGDLRWKAIRRLTTQLI